MNVLVTGAKGFIGKNHCCVLKNIRDGKDCREEYAGLQPLEVMEYDIDSTPKELDEYCSRADFVFNLAGVEFPEDEAKYMECNYGFASVLLDTLERHGNTCPVMLASSLQEHLFGHSGDTLYGESKRAAEKLFREYSERTGAPVLIYRFPNVYGKWCTPRSSALATYFDSYANGRPLTVDDATATLELLYIDDLVDEMLDAMLGQEHRCGYDGTERVEGYDFCCVPRTNRGPMAAFTFELHRFSCSRDACFNHNLATNSFTKKLWSTFQSYRDFRKLTFRLESNADERGSLTKFLGTPDRGQVSIDVCKPGATKGNHWHMSKWERLLVVSGTASIMLRRVVETDEDDLYHFIEYVVSGFDMTVVEIPPGYAHSIHNISSTEDLVTVVWANETFYPGCPETFDTYYEEVWE